MPIASGTPAALPRLLLRGLLSPPRPSPPAPTWGRGRTGSSSLEENRNRLLRKAPRVLITCVIVACHACSLQKTDMRKENRVSNYKTEILRCVRFTFCEVAKQPDARAPFSPLLFSCFYARVHPKVYTSGSWGRVGSRTSTQDQIEVAENFWDHFGVARSEKGLETAGVHKGATNTLQAMNVQTLWQ